MPEEGEGCEERDRSSGPTRWDAWVLVAPHHVARLTDWVQISGIGYEPEPINTGRGLKAVAA